jgi:hypothetical protein
MRHSLPQTVIVHGEELIFILLDNLTDKVTVIMQHDGEDGYSSHRRTFIPSQ